MDTCVEVGLVGEVVTLTTGVETTTRTTRDTVPQTLDPNDAPYI